MITIGFIDYVPFFFFFEPFNVIESRPRSQEKFGSGSKSLFTGTLTSSAFFYSSKAGYVSVFYSLTSS